LLTAFDSSLNWSHGLTSYRINTLLSCSKLQQQIQSRGMEYQVSNLSCMRSPYMLEFTVFSFWCIMCQFCNHGDCISDSYLNRNLRCWKNTCLQRKHTHSSQAPNMLRVILYSLLERSVSLSTLFWMRPYLSNPAGLNIHLKTGNNVKPSPI